MLAISFLVLQAILEALYTKVAHFCFRLVGIRKAVARMQNALAQYELQRLGLRERHALGSRAMNITSLSLITQDVRAIFASNLKFIISLDTCLFRESLSS